jgi:hypothetical protein
MKSVIGSALILVSLYLGYTGITKMSNSEKSVEIIGIELSASDEDKKSTGIIYLGLSVVSLIGGVTLLARK